MPGLDETQLSVEDPDPPVTESDESEHVKFVEFVVVASPTVPVNPLRDPTVIVEAPAAPASSITLAGLGVSVKSCTL